MHLNLVNCILKMVESTPLNDEVSLIKELADQRSQWSNSVNKINILFSETLLDWASIAFGAYMFRQGPK